MIWRSFFWRRQWHEERLRELEAYLETETAQNVARGMDAGLARDAARRKLGNSTIILEDIYRMNSIGFVEPLWQDVRYGFRVLWKSPALTLVALLSLALGIGATTAMFSVVYGVLISPYPYAKPDQIWAPQMINAKKPDQGRYTLHPNEYLELQKLSAFSDVMATSPESRLLTGERAPESFRAVMVTANGFSFLGVEPVLGRGLLPSDVQTNGQAEPVVVLSYKAWQRLFNGSPDALGKRIVLNDLPQTVVGVMPARFGWWTDDGGWLPLSLDLHADRELFPIVRLKPGVSAAAAQQQVHAMNLSLAQQNPANFPREGFNTRLTNYLDMTVASGSEMRSSLRLLFGAVGFLLLIACANVANLQLARATSRVREIALRMSVGATRVRVIRQLLTESVVLSVAGGALGVLFAFGITQGTVALMPDFYVPNEARITLNNYVLVFSAVVSVLTGILFGLAPALQCSRPDLAEVLKDGAKGAGAQAGLKTRNVLVAAEVALSVVLLMGASLTIRGFVDLRSTDPGFQANRVLMVGIQLPVNRYSTYQQRIAFAQRLLENVRSIPGVQAVSIGNGGLPFGGAQSPYVIEGHPQTEARQMTVELISPEYTQTMGIPLRSGRELSESEVARAERSALINEAAARLWPAGESPIGRHVQLDIFNRPNSMAHGEAAQRLQAGPASTSAAPESAPSVTIVGIIANTRNDGISHPPVPAIYIPYTLFSLPGRTLALRTQGDPMLLLNAVRQQVQLIDKDQPIGRPITMEEALGWETVQPRFNMALFSFFGMVGLALAAAGIFSVLSYSVVRRTHEIGVRMALGARSGDVVGLMLGMGAKLVGTGLGVGLAASFLLFRFLRSEVFRVPVSDPLTIAGVAALLGLVALLACLAPARRAANLNPTVALRHE
jgi:putative ABC transport system permease protein